MINKRFFLWSGLTSILTLALATNGLSQAQVVQSRIPQPVVINGQQVNGFYVLGAGGGFQSFTCPNPQQYSAVDGSSQGWACFEPATGGWLLNAVAPGQAQVAPPVVYQQPAVIYQPAPTVVYRRPVRPVVVAPAYPPSVVFGTAAIHAAGDVASAAFASHGGGYYVRGSFGRGRRH